MFPIIMLFFWFAILFVLFKLFGINRVFDIFCIILISINVFFVLKNGVKKDDFKWQKIKDMEIVKYGGVALFYLICWIFVWVTMIYIRNE